MKYFKERIMGALCATSGMCIGHHFHSMSLALGIGTALIALCLALQCKRDL